MVHKMHVEMSIHFMDPQSRFSCVMLDLADSDPSVRWTGCNEISLDGKLYDIFYKVRKGPRVHYFCLRDSREEVLLAGMKKVMNTRMISLLLDDTLKIFPVDEGNARTELVREDVRFIRFTELAESITPDCLTPPPEIC
jgi:hypothetical protein